MDLSGTLVGAHRGLRLRYPDNTIAGILAARAVADLCELDVRRTSEGVIVLSHDVELAGKVVVDSTWEDLATIDLGQGHPPARFDRLLSEVGEFPLDIEIKNDPGDVDFDPSFGFPLEAAGMARSYDIVTSFHWETMNVIHSTYPDLRTGLLVGPTDSLEVARDEAVRSGHRILAAHWWLLGDEPGESVEDLEGRGLEVVVWTVDDENTATLLAAAGVGAIISDDPERIGRAVRRHE
jgi:glycerophosphoryl diester phosphodiesterase